MGSPDSLITFLREQFWPIAIVVVVIALMLLVLKLSAASRHRALTRERDGVTEDTFSAHMAQQGYDRVVAASTYRYLQEVQRVQFPILPGDALDEDLGLDSEDISQTIRELTAALHREMTPGLLHKPLVTVEDLVRLLQSSPRMRGAQTEAA